MKNTEVNEQMYRNMEQTVEITTNTAENTLESLPTTQENSEY